MLNKISSVAFLKEKYSRVTLTFTRIVKQSRMHKRKIEIDIRLLPHCSRSALGNVYLKEMFDRYFGKKRSLFRLFEQAYRGFTVGNGVFLAMRHFKSIKRRLHLSQASKHFWT